MQIHGDRPIQRRNEDTLGFTEIAESVARAMIDPAFDRGLVVGIEGSWGSGKSSLLQLVRFELENADVQSRPAIVTFSPWLIGDRDALLRSFFDDLAKTLARFEPATPGTDRTEGLSDRVRRYAKRLDKAAPVVSTLLGLLNSKAGDLAEAAFETLQDATEDEQPLEGLKDEIADMLCDLPNRVVVFIDDLDRLEPAEIGEIIRLVRSVADFENVVYVLCYDQDILARSVEQVLHVRDGHAFLEKIIQLSVPVPAPEPFALRRLLQDRVTSIRWDGEDRDTATADVPSGEEARMSEVIDGADDQLPTPRQVIRVADAVSFCWTELRGQVDFPDLVWLQLIRLSNRELYKWIERYIAAYVSVEYENANLDDSGRMRLFAELKDILSKKNKSFEDVRFELGNYLPGIQGADPHDDQACGIFAQEYETDLHELEIDKRLKSPAHHRLFFAWNKPSGVVDDAGVAEFMSWAVHGVDMVVSRFQQMFDESHAGVGSRGEQLLQRLGKYQFQDFEAQQCATIIEAFANTLDYPISPMAERPWGGWPHWRMANRLLHSLKKTAGEFSNDAVERAFRDGWSIGWLTDILRKESFAHGLHGNQRRDPKDWIFDEAELSWIIEILHARYDEMDLEMLRSTPEPASVLYAWSQSGGDAQAREFVRVVSESEQGLVSLLECFVSVVHSSVGNYHRLQRNGLEAFLDVDSTIARLQVLEKQEDVLSGQASDLLSALRNDDR